MRISEPAVFTEKIYDTDEIAQRLLKMLRKTLNGLDNSPLTITIPAEGVREIYNCLVNQGLIPKGWKDCE